MLFITKSARTIAAYAEYQAFVKALLAFMHSPCDDDFRFECPEVTDQHRPALLVLPCLDGRVVINGVSAPLVAAALAAVETGNHKLFDMVLGMAGLVDYRNPTANLNDPDHDWASHSKECGGATPRCVCAHKSDVSGFIGVCKCPDRHDACRRKLFDRTTSIFDDPTVLDKIDSDNLGLTPSDFLNGLAPAAVELEPRDMEKSLADFARASVRPSWLPACFTGVEKAPAQAKNAAVMATIVSTVLLEAAAGNLAWAVGDALTGASFNVSRFNSCRPDNEDQSGFMDFAPLSFVMAGAIVVVAVKSKADDVLQAFIPRFVALAKDVKNNKASQGGIAGISSQCLWWINCDNAEVITDILHIASDAQRAIIGDAR